MELWPHQTAVLTSLVLGHWLLLWAPGTGKTAALIIAGGIVGGRQLWLCPAVLIAQTVSEIRRWRPGATIQILTTGREAVHDDRDIVIMSYDLMRRPATWRQLYAIQWDSCVCDEGHVLGHGGSIRTRAFYGARENSPGALFRRCDRVWIATGTPVLNSPDELWTHLSRLFPHLLGEIRTKNDFLDRYCILAHKQWGLVVVGGRNLPELGALLGSAASRLNLEDVTDLPRLTVDRIDLEIGKRDRAAIEAAMTQAQSRELNIVLTQIEGGDDAAWQRLQAMLLPLASMRRVTAFAKAQSAVDIIKAELTGGTDRVVLFGLHLDALKYVTEHTAAFRPVLLIGDTRPDVRDTRIRQFTDGDSRLLIASVRLAGFGLNLQAARRCFFLETDWTPAAFDQAVARLYRAGQKRPVHASSLVVSRSVDARVADVIWRKRRVINEIMGAVA